MRLAEEVSKAGFNLEVLDRVGPTDMRYEVWAKDGTHFTSGEHSRVFFDAQEVRSFLAEFPATEPCNMDCDDYA